jgi:hypothetical protein
VDDRFGSPAKAINILHLFRFGQTNGNSNSRTTGSAPAHRSKAHRKRFDTPSPKIAARAGKRDDGGLVHSVSLCMITVRVKGERPWAAGRFEF